MHQLNNQFLTDMQNLQTSVDELNQQVKHYKQIIKELKDAQESIVTSTQKTRANLDAGREEYQHCCELISAHNQELNTLCQAIGASSKNLTTDSVSLRKLTSKYQLAITEMQTSTNLILKFIEKIRPKSKSEPQTKHTSETTTRLSLKHQTIECVAESESLKILKDAKQARKQSSLVLERVKKTTKEQNMMSLI